MIFDAITKARMWNHRAKTVMEQVPGKGPAASRKLDDELKSRIGFKCKPKGGGRCDGKTDFYWYVFGDLRICAGWRQIPTSEGRALSMLEALYGYRAGLDEDKERTAMARNALMIHTHNLLSAVLAGK